MNLKLTRLHLPHNKNFARHFKSGVSLHCHTQFSKEMMDFIPDIAAKLPIISFFWERERRKYEKREGKTPDFSENYWTPPLAARRVYELEQNQISQDLNLNPLVSITDHDDINAGQKIRQDYDDAKNAPISMEWTVPFEFGFFHVGVHNLPENRADEITKDLLDFTFAKKRNLTFEENRLDELFAMLDEIPEVLIVLNHPLWDIELVGKERHNILLDNFIAKHGRWLHAFEVNGFRAWSENKAVLEMADTLGFPVVSGGDRHGCQPNSVVNLTTTSTFDEFAAQIKFDKHSQIVLMKQYEQPLAWRQLESFAEILRDYPDYEGARKHWTGRVHVKIDERGVNPLSFFWKKGGPKWLKAATWTLGALGHERMRPVFRAVRPQKDLMPKLLEVSESQNYRVSELRGSKS
ncbi:MAG: hypothetical protein H7Z37_02285 [Pyrinomonadaceae bacterium]|nr:hypothetical protein [Pyrinomonadaceae bacterium]